MRRIVWAMMAMMVILIGVPKSVAQVTFPFPTLYDDFHGAQIDPARWDSSDAFGYEMSRGLDQTIGLGRLVMSVQAYGNVGAPAPLDPNIFNGVIFFNMVNAAAASAIGIQVTANIEDVNVTGCETSSPSRSRADLFARLFRDGPNPPNPNDLTGVVFAVNAVRAQADLPLPTLRVEFFAERCLNVNCDTDTDLGGGVFQDATLGQDVTLGMELDAANNRIIFTKDAETQFINNVSTNPINTDLKNLHRKGIRVLHKLETCPTQPQGFIAASFENFRIKP